MFDEFFCSMSITVAVYMLVPILWRSVDVEHGVEPLRLTWVTSDQHHRNEWD